MHAEGPPAEDPLELRLRQALALSSEEQRRLSPLSVGLRGGGERIEALLPALRPAAVLAPLVRRPSGLHVLLTRRSDHLRTHQGQVSFPGGRRDEGDRSLVETALREAEEEISLARAHVEVIGFLDDYPTFTNFRITPVVAFVQGEPALRHDVREVAEIFELPLALVLDPQNYEYRSLVADGVQAHYYEMRYAPQRIWGATAGILRNLCQIVTGR